MYHIVQDVASLITMSSENHSSTALSLQDSPLQTSPKYTGDIHGMFVAGVVTKRGTFLSVDPFKEKKQINIGSFI